MSVSLRPYLQHPGTPLPDINVRRSNTDNLTRARLCYGLRELVVDNGRDVLRKVDYKTLRERGRAEEHRVVLARLRRGQVARLETLLRGLREVAECVVVAVYAQSHVVSTFP